MSVISIIFVVAEMFESLHSALKLDKIPFQECKFIHLVEEEDLLGTFLTYHFLHLALR